MLPMITVILNGKEKKCEPKLNLKSLISQYCLNSQHVIAEVNGNIVKKNSWETTPITSGDKIELVSMVGGG